MPHALAGTKAQDQKLIRDLVHSVLRRENGLLTRSETWAEPMAVRSLDSERYKAICGKEVSQNLFAESGKKMKGIGNLNQLSEGQRSTVVTWTLLRLLTCLVSRHGASVQDVKNNLTPGVNDGPPALTKLRPGFPRTVRTLAGHQT